MLIGLLLGSSLVSLVTLNDLTYEGMLVRFETGATAPVFVSLLVIYFLLSTLIAKMIDVVERRVRRGIDPSSAKTKKTSVAMAGATA